MSTSPLKMLAAPVFAAAAVALVFPATSVAQEKVTWRVQSHWPSASSSYKDSLVTLKAKLAACTNGQLVLDLHEAGALFPAKEIFPAVKRGVIQMGTISPA